MTAKISAHAHANCAEQQMLTMLLNLNCGCVPATAVPAHLSQLCHLELACLVLPAGDALWQWCTASIWQGDLAVHPQPAAS